MENKDDIIDITSEIRQRGIEGERGAFKHGTKARMLPSGGKLFLLTHPSLCFSNSLSLSLEDMEDT